MRVILKPAFELLTGKYSLFDNAAYDLMATALIGVLAFVVAWEVVKGLRNGHIISGGDISSLVHWAVRLVAFVFLIHATQAAIHVVKFVLSVPIWAWYSLAGVLVILLVSLAIRSHVTSL